VSIQLDSTVQIAVLGPLQVVNDKLLELLDSFRGDDWHRPTVHKDRNVKDLTAHLLHGSIRRVSAMRDGYRSPTTRSFTTHKDLTQFIQEDNRAFMNAMSGVSPEILCELIRYYDPELMNLFKALEPDAPGLGVVWAGEWQSPNWFDVAREYTEKWHHQEQLRDATNRPGLSENAFMVPVLGTFARGLPYAYRGLEAPAGGLAPPGGATISISTGTPVTWTLKRADDAWTLWSGLDPNPDTLIAADADLLWRLWTKGISPAEGRNRVQIQGNAKLADPLFKFVAIMA
jgi:hypothetical protein